MVKDSASAPEDGGRIRIELDKQSTDVRRRRNPLTARTGRVMERSARIDPQDPSRRRLERQLAVQYAIAGAFADGQGLGDVAAPLLQTLVDSLGWESAALWVADEAEFTLDCAAVYPTEGPLAPWAERTLGFRPAIGVGLPGRVWASGESVWISDTEGDTNFPRQPAARAVGLRHGYAFPIKVRGVVRAVIELLAADVRDMEAEV